MHKSLLYHSDDNTRGVLKLFNVLTGDKECILKHVRNQESDFDFVSILWFLGFYMFKLVQ